MDVLPVTATGGVGEGRFFMWRTDIFQEALPKFTLPIKRFSLTLRVLSHVATIRPFIAVVS